MTDQNQQASEAVELLPCPFCGGEANHTVTTSDERISTRFTVICCSCGGSSKWCSSEKDAAESWNTRALTPKCDAEAVERIADDTATRLYIAWGTRPNNPGRMVDFIAPFIKAAITQALQSRDAENAQDKAAREIAWDAVTHIRENNLPIEGSYLVNYFEQAIERGAAQATQRLNERVRELENKNAVLDGYLNVSAKEIDRLSAELARVKKGVQDAYNISRLAPELNPSNYGHDDVCSLNDAMVGLHESLRAIAEVEREEK